MSAWAWWNLGFLYLDKMGWILVKVEVNIPPPQRKVISISKNATILDLVELCLTCGWESKRCEKKYGTPSVSKWLSAFLTWARFRSAGHWPNSCKYDFLNKHQQLLRNVPGSCGVKRLLDIEGLVENIWLWATISSQADNQTCIWDSEIWE